MNTNSPLEQFYHSVDPYQPIQLDHGTGRLSNGFSENFNTPPKFNIVPENFEKSWLEDYFPFRMAYFQGGTVKLPGSRRSLRLSGDSWMYPYQRTPMRNPNISPIYPYIVGVYGLLSPRIQYKPYKYHGSTRTLGGPTQLSLEITQTKHGTKAGKTHPNL